MSRWLLTILSVCFLAGWPTPLAAQPASPVAVSFRADVVPSDAGTSAVVGGSVIYALHERVALEAEATYFAKTRWSSAIVVAGSALVAVGPGGWSDSVVPYLTGGVGYHRASVVLSDGRLLGAIPGSIAPGERYCVSRGSGMGPGPGSGLSPCSTDPRVGHWGVGELPEFYAARLGMLVVPATGRWGDRTFDDPAVTIGGGMRIGARDRLFLQPEARVWIVAAGGRTRVSGLFGVTAGYRF